jgi:hypothetical protein
VEQADQRIMAYLTGQAAPDVDNQLEVRVTARSDRQDIDDALRHWGYNRIERERLRRGTPRPRNRGDYRAVTVKRFAYYIGKLLPERPPEEVNGLAATWAALSEYNVDRAQRWWSNGVDPAQPGQFADAIAAGLEPSDLGEVIHNRTIAEHLRAGNSLAWCVDALRWMRRSA